MSADAPMRAFRNDREDYFTHGMDEYPWPSRAFYAFAAWVVGIFVRLMWPTRFDGDVDGFLATARERGCVIVMNHVSMIEPVVLTIMMWSHRLHVRAIYKREFDSNPLNRWIFSRVGGIPVDRGTADLKAIRNAQHACQRGECIIIFPEGTRIKTDDQPVELHGGFALIASMAKCPVVPMAVIGARKTAPDGRRLPARRPVMIRVGEPMSVADAEGTGRKEKVANLERGAMERVYALRDELRAENPGMW